MLYRRVRIIENRVRNGVNYAYYAIPIPQSIAPLWSGAQVLIQNDGNTLIIQKIKITKNPLIHHENLL